MILDTFSASIGSFVQWTLLHIGGRNVSESILSVRDGGLSLAVSAV